ncbi:MAG: glutathione peroxidase [Proteobacteria bacterium]|nr:MAG: glutathione peroxidase [Pseudomonadota bacterium]
MTMHKNLAILLATVLACFTSLSHAAGGRQCSPLLDHDIRLLGEKQSVNLCRRYQGKVVMIVNTASRCAFTPQYEALENLYRRYRDNGFVVLGFPSNDFGNQEPGTEAEIKSFCRLTYNVGFPMFEKTRAARAQADPIYHALGKAAGVYPKWNFYKYVIDRQGALAGHFSSGTAPDNEVLTRLLEELL